MLYHTFTSISSMLSPDPAADVCMKLMSQPAGSAKRRTLQPASWNVSSPAEAGITFTLEAAYTRSGGFQGLMK